MSDYNLDKEIEEGLARAKQMLRKQQRQRIFIAMIGLIVVGMIASMAVLWQKGKLPTFLVTATPTAAPTSTPAPTAIPVPAKVREYLQGITPQHLETFQRASPVGWTLNGITAQNGVLEIAGKDWFAVVHERDIRARQGVLVDFSFDTGAQFEVYLHSGDFGNSNYKRFGFYIENNSLGSNLWQGANPIGGPVAVSHKFAPGTTYTLLLAVLPEAEFMGVIWEKDNLSRTLAIYEEKLGSNWKALTWTFLIGVNHGTPRFDNVLDFSFTGKK